MFTVVFILICKMKYAGLYTLFHIVNVIFQITYRRLSFLYRFELDFLVQINSEVHYIFCCHLLTIKFDHTLKCTTWTLSCFFTVSVS